MSLSFYRLFIDDVHPKQVCSAGERPQPVSRGSYWRSAFSIEWYSNRSKLLHLNRFWALKTGIQTVTYEWSSSLVWSICLRWLWRRIWGFKRRFQDDVPCDFVWGVEECFQSKKVQRCLHLFNFDPFVGKNLFNRHCGISTSLQGSFL